MSNSTIKPWVDSSLDGFVSQAASRFASRIFTQSERIVDNSLWNSCCALSAGRMSNRSGSCTPQLMIVSAFSSASSCRTKRQFSPLKKIRIASAGVRCPLPSDSMIPRLSQAKSADFCSAVFSGSERSLWRLILLLFFLTSRIFRLEQTLRPQPYRTRAQSSARHQCCLL